MLITEAGHCRFEDPKRITVLLDGEPVTFDDVAMIDPRFEFHNLPPGEGSKAQKFLGESPYSLPLVNPKGQQSGWIVSAERWSMMSGLAHWSDKPQGRYEDVPLNWADKALIMNSNMDELVSQHRQAATTAGAQQATGTHGPTHTAPTPPLKVVGGGGVPSPV